ncbi:MAG: SRPBCC family protein [Myxococcota bacterium]
MPSSTDRIEKKIVLRAPHERVWRAITDSKQFGTWFGVDFDGPFVAGTKLNGRIVPTKVDPVVAKAQEPHAGKPFVCLVERIEPMSHFSFRWHPYDVDPNVDTSKEPTTLVVFELQPVSAGIELTISESGFDQIPIERRAEAFASNQEGWAAQSKLIEKYLAGGVTTTFEMQH